MGPETDKIDTSIGNAGLVLLWPFLGTLFERSGLMDDGRFHDEGAADRAVHVVQLALGSPDPSDEMELALNKLLCGLTLEHSVPRSIEPTDGERELVGDLLVHVLRTWESLSTTSVDGFQGSFLVRRGRLSLRDESWRLNVEKKAYDILLETLPWSISVVKTAWMENPILVDWR